MAKQSRSLSDFTLFLYEWLRDRRHRKQIGAVAPSSPGLCRAMTDWLPAPEEFVVELGPGTGVVTQTLLERGVPPDRLIAIEMSAKLAGMIRERFPGIHVINGDACQMDQLIREQVPQAKTIGAVISSLPLRNFPPALADALAKQIHQVLRPEGRWVQFSYRIRTNRHQGDHYFKALPSKIVWLNIPPARVSVFQK
jgi:phospholipid N-methyltransferase